MNSKEAVRLAREAHAKLLIPMHYDLYEPNGEDPGNFVRELYAAEDCPSTCSCRASGTYTAD